MNIRSFWLCIAIISVWDRAFSAHRAHSGSEPDEESSSLVLDESKLLIKQWLLAHHLPTENLARNLTFLNRGEDYGITCIMQLSQKAWAWRKQRQKLFQVSPLSVFYYGVVGAGVGVLAGGAWYYCQEETLAGSALQKLYPGLYEGLHICGGSIVGLLGGWLTHKCKFHKERDVSFMHLSSDGETVKICLPGLVRYLSTQRHAQ